MMDKTFSRRTPKNPMEEHTHPFNGPLSGTTHVSWASHKSASSSKNPMEEFTGNIQPM